MSIGIFEMRPVHTFFYCYDVAPTELFSTIDKDVTESKSRRMSIGIFEKAPIDFSLSILLLQTHSG